MVRRAILPALVAAVAFMSGASWAQSTESNQVTDPNRDLPDKIREKLTAQGYEDVKVAPSSFVVSAKDKNGQRVMMLISPTSMTMMKVPDDPSTARVPDPQDKIIQQ